jgi:uncharacterized membrane-anchored protein
MRAMNKSLWLVTIGLALSSFPPPANAKSAHKEGAKPPAPGAAKDDSASNSKEATNDRPGDDSGDGDADKEKFDPLVGPRKVDIGHDLTLDLPAGYVLLEAPQAKKLMERMGNLGNDNLLGVATKPDATWIVTIRFTEEGYVKDDEAEKMDADEILKTIREGTEEANQEREKRGFRPMHVVGWSEPPHYERKAHHLIWGITGHGEGDDGDVINYNTRVLGRKGYVALNLIDDAKQIAGGKPDVAKLLAATTYNAGARYEDFDKKSDKVAEYGLAALVVGGAGAAALKLVKIGLLAKFGGKLIALLIAFKKLLIVGLVAIGAGIKRLFGIKKKEAVVEAAAAPTPAAAAPAPAAAPPPSGAEQHPGEGGPGGQHGA